MDNIESNIWVFVEHRQGRIMEVSLELIGKSLESAKTVGWKVAAVLVGNDLSSLTKETLTYGVDEVLTADDPLLEQYCSQSYAKVLAAAVKRKAPEVMMLGATAVGADLGPRLAARLRTGLSAHCVDMELTGQGELLAVVPGWGGSVMARISCPRTRPQMATVKPGVFDLPESGEAKGRVIGLETELNEGDVTYRVLETVIEEAKGSALDNAEVVVAGGWGVGSMDNWKLLEQLAASLGGAVAATRPPVDEGWAEENQMIGTSGRTIKPKLYIGVALSGHMHHLVGVKNPGLMVGINQDPDADIFEHCDLGLTGDFKEIIPELLKAIQQYSGA